MALLGVLEAGAAYVPVDWSTPQDRVDYIAAESEAFAVVTTALRAPDFPASLPNVIAVDAAIGDVAAFSTDPLTRADTGAEPEDAAYLIYTSGSTGRPKGVVIRNRNACFQIRSEASILGVTSSGPGLCGRLARLRHLGGGDVGGVPERGGAAGGLGGPGQGRTGPRRHPGGAGRHRLVPGAEPAGGAGPRRGHRAHHQRRRGGLPARAGAALGAARPAHAEHLRPDRDHRHRHLDRAAARPPRHHRHAAAGVHRLDRGRPAAARPAGRGGRAGDRRPGPGAGLPAPGGADGGEVRHRALRGPGRLAPPHLPHRRPHPADARGRDRLPRPHRHPGEDPGLPGRTRRDRVRHRRRPRRRPGCGEPLPGGGRERAARRLPDARGAGWRSTSTASAPRWPSACPPTCAPTPTRCVSPCPR